MAEPEQEPKAEAVALHNTAGRGPVLIVCEHASRRMPDRFGVLGLTPDQLKSHIAWDPGALPVARRLSAHFDAPLVAGGMSRLLFDCNRPPGAPDAIPTQSEGQAIPGNLALDDTGRAERVRDIHDPFRAALKKAMSGFATPPVVITVHSFTPVFLGVARQVQIGLIHDEDDRLARAMLTRAGQHTGRVVALNDPYDPQDGVTHTLRSFALPAGAVNIMLEIRNDLIGDAQAQSDMADMLAGWIAVACDDLGVSLDPGAAACAE
ncbi:N-formylglutamate amidohydrolase [Sedimentitalea sp. JM2-8]|uniref:N-formylglutamate amidohydrolase n=1 Tax=Sedimentitalea xiamensis TaxID=3050037 RepID=A0ABT7FG23_9RHOB|nr:N-formylglutamate amidohydrolase [Sedimentitalea xiamensis]MDK3074076.1 N-formylglutamate amidohydrolase [Sedimentitalea xiamensis]